MKARFDDPTIRNLKIEAKTYDCMAEKEPGFGIRIHPSGTMTFFYQYKVDGIDAILNHAKQGVIKVYNQYRYELEKQKALETWERKLICIISGTQKKVISIHTGRKKA
jgi:hypothetical protein